MTRFIRISLLLFLVTCSARPQAQPFYIDAETASYIQDAVYSPRHNHVFFFSGSSVMMYDMASTQPVQPTWYSLGQIGKIDASVLWDDNFLLLFVGANYCMYDIDSARIISTWVLWPNLPKEWNGKLDAAVRWGEQEIMFFSGKEYLLYHTGENAYKERGSFVKWEGWPPGWQGDLQAVLNVNDTIYFLQGGNFITLDTKNMKFSEPRSIVAKN